MSIRDHWAEVLQILAIIEDDYDEEKRMQMSCNEWTFYFLWGARTV